MSIQQQVTLHSNSKTKSCLEPELEVDKDDGRRVGAEAEAELVKLLRVSDVAWQANAARRPTPEQQLQVYGCFRYIIVENCLPIQRRQRSHARELCKTIEETLFSSSSGSTNIV